MIRCFIIMIRFALIGLTALSGCGRSPQTPVPATKPQSPAANHLYVESEASRYGASVSDGEEFRFDMIAGQLSLEEMGAYWKDYFANAIKGGHTAMVSKTSEDGWRVQLDIPTRLQQPTTLVMLASLSTSDGVELATKKVWTLEQDIDYSEPFPDFAADRRIECLLEELPAKMEIVLTLSVRPRDNPEAEPQSACSQAFPITIEP